ncbi:hypothetical protein DH2020_010894 [Rehmannia glutinosa]|uniref:Pentatricopeptide repeat-containing protein n=1 Tax=Rehmannia glutinosa TaxID=99300 RepID=A0ABR0XCK7_REHGL
MASLKLSVSPDNNSYESNKLISGFNSLKFVSNTLFSGYVSTHGALIVKPFCKLKHIRVSRLDNESLDTCESNLDGFSIDNLEKYVAGDDNLIIEGQDFHGDSGKRKVNIWKKFRGAKTVRKNTIRNLDFHRNGNKYKKHENPMVPLQKNSANPILDGHSVVDLDFNDVGPELSSERCNFILEQLEKSNDSRALTFFEWMKVNGKLKNNVTAYNSILRVLGRKGDWDGAEVMIMEMVSDSDCELNYRIFNTLIYACYKSGLVDLGSRWFKMMLDYKVQPNVATFGMLMSLYQKGSVVEEAEYTFSQMRNLKITEDKVVLNRENWLVMLNAYCQQGKLSEAEQVLCAMRKARFSPCIVAYNTMITGYGRVSRMDHAENIFCNLKEAGFVPDETTYRSLIEGWGRADSYKQAKFYYMELKRLGYKPNSSNLYTLIRLQAKHGDEDGAVKTINDMMMIGCQKSSILGIVLQAYEKANRLDRMSSILEGSLHDHVLKNQTSCTILVTAYVKNCLIDNALNVLSEKQWDDPIFEDNLYHLLICSCKDLGHLENAIKIFTCMPKSAKPNLNIFCTMIDIYSKLSLFSEAEKLYIELKNSDVKLDMIAFSVKNIVPDVYLLRDILRIYQRCGMDDKLADLYYKVLKNGEIWDEEMYNCVINCCARALPVDELSRLFDEMLQRGFAPNTLTYLKNMSAAVRRMQFDGFSVSLEAYNCMLDAYGKEGEMDKFRSVLQRMKVSKCSSDHYTYNILINIYGEQGWIDEVSGVLMELKECGFSPDLCSYNTLIKAYGIAGMVEDAVGLVKEMRENGIEPDRITYTNLINALKKNDMFLEAVKWSLWMKQMGL